VRETTGERARTQEGEHQRGDRVRMLEGKINREGKTRKMLSITTRNICKTTAQMTGEERFN